MIKHLVIVGPTASGKTALSIKAALLLDAELICADSRTVYRGMNIGTAKPTQSEQSIVPHHCLDLVYPNQQFTVADFTYAAKAAHKSIQSRNKATITVGGSGLFIDGFVYNYSFHPPNHVIREYYKDWDIEDLQEQLVAKGIPLPVNYNNKRHLILALEREGLPDSTKDKLGKDTVIIGLNPPKKLLHERMQLRAEQMLKDGVVEEVRTMLVTYGADQKAFLGGPYSALRQYCGGTQTIEHAKAAMLSYDKKLAKRQITWFKRNADIKWFESADEAMNWLQYTLESTL